MIRFVHKNHQPIGLDLGADCIKMIQLEPTDSGLRVAAAAQYYFPPDLAAEAPERGDLAVKAVQRMHRLGGFRGRQVISAVADSELAIKTIRVPEGAPEQMEQAIAEEAGKRLPFEPASARVEHLDVGRVQQGNDACREIILLAVQDQDVRGEIESVVEDGPGAGGAGHGAVRAVSQLRAVPAARRGPQRGHAAGGHRGDEHEGGDRTRPGHRVHQDGGPRRPRHQPGGCQEPGPVAAGGDEPAGVAGAGADAGGRGRGERRPGRGRGGPGGLRAGTDADCQGGSRCACGTTR